MAANVRRCVVLSNGIVGAEKQALALASALGLPYRVEPAIRFDKSPLWSLPTPALLAGVHAGAMNAWLPTWRPPHPEVAISCGRGSIPASVQLRSASRGRTVTIHVQKPACDERLFDLVVAPRHDYSAAEQPSNVILTDGSLHGVTNEALSSARDEWASEFRELPGPRLSVLIGGQVSRRWWQQPLAPTVSGRFSGELLESALQALRQEGSGSLLVTASRRTPDEALARVRDELKRAKEVFPEVVTRMWTPDGSSNPYMGLLAWSDYILVTADSINMVTEACGSGKPVYVASPHLCQRRFASFHQAMIERGRTRSWPTDDGRLEPSSAWTLEPGCLGSNEAAARINELLDLRCAS